MKRELEYAILLLLSLNLSLYAQAITNVLARQEGDEIVVTYDLDSLSIGEEIIFGYTVDDGNSWRRINDAAGDLGKNIPLGNRKTIRWLISPEDANQTVKFKINSLNLHNMIWVEGGTFQMGSNSGDIDEKPVHTVTISGFFMDKYEVTQSEYRRVVGKNPSFFKNCDKCPVEHVSWHDAIDYASKIGKRLPTEAEWEYAARGGNQSRRYRYAGGDDLDPVGWYRGNSMGKTHPVGLKEPNELGLYDMSGNVWEWCSDRYHEDYYSKSPSTNPKGADYPYSRRVLRGNSWYDDDFSFTYRKVSSPSERKGYYLKDGKLIDNIGFRCVYDF